MSPEDGPAAATPLVSVIIPTYNSREFLAEALTAIRAQTLGAEQIETIVIDDGSTDDTWDYLQGLAEQWPQLRIFTQANSGAPSVGRNVGLRVATGRYLFFHDADDWLADDALDRLTAAAEDFGADVVVGQVRVVGRQGWTVNKVRAAADADLIEDRIWTTLSAQKLFRRALIDRLSLEFCEDMVQGEDQVFVATALLAAKRVTSLTDSTYYFRRRNLPGSLSRQPQTLQNKLLTATRMTELIMKNVEPQQRSRYFDRVLIRVVAPSFGGPFMRADETEREVALAELKRTVLSQLEARHLDRAREDARLRLMVASRGGAEDIVALNEWIAAGRARSAFGDRLRYDLPDSLNALLTPAELIVRTSPGAPRPVVEPHPAGWTRRLRTRAGGFVGRWRGRLT
ncbi:glycosyltransferase family 2 protein [Microlunatus elymi]|uniref:glycosyltransferase family 2 protein n=1 Tax=Microlunatus elymi TaxID=2596828 RepID=UPI00143E0DC8|nr:glycosyltransferase [Microlunatus elymi]